MGSTVSWCIMCIIHRLTVQCVVERISDETGKQVDCELDSQRDEGRPLECGLICKLPILSLL